MCNKPLSSLRINQRASRGDCGELVNFVFPNNWESAEEGRVAFLGGFIFLEECFDRSFRQER